MMAMALALAAVGAPVPELGRGDWTARSGYEASGKLVDDPQVTAVFVANERMAMGVLRAVREAGRKVPEDISVVGFDDIPEAEFQMIPLTTMRQDFEKSTRVAVNELVLLMEGRSSGRRQIVFVPELVIRNSSGGCTGKSGLAPPLGPGRLRSGVAQLLGDRQRRLLHDGH
jgi:DNA-binding LacI/PurR family transcriptional regulator